MARSKAYGRLQGLVELGLVEHERRVPGLGVFLATRRGLAAAEVELAPARVSLDRCDTTWPWRRSSRSWRSLRSEIRC
jgi:hypothetical protein